MNKVIISPASAPLRGSVCISGDKSISHRRALLSLTARDDVYLRNFGVGCDCRTTLRCIERLGKCVVRKENDVIISGTAHFSSGILNCENSGTTARLLMGLLAGREGEWTLVGDESLSRRPMERVAAPLRQMGARIELTNGRLPARIVGTRLRGIEYDSDVASAQVKSAVLLAGLSADGITRYREPIPTRDHTERILNVSRDDSGWIAVNSQRILPADLNLSESIPADVSSAAFWIAAAITVPDSELVLPGVLMNPIRRAYMEILTGSGACIHFENEDQSDPEPFADVVVSATRLSEMKVHGASAARSIDEIPVLAVLAASADGCSEFHDVGELRVKESDRLDMIVENLRLMGAKIDVNGNSFSISGGQDLNGADIEPAGDHRIAMALAVAGLTARGRTVINDASCVGISYPAFWDDLNRVAPDSVLVED